METKSIIIGVGVGLLAASVIYLLSNQNKLPVATSIPNTETAYKNDETMQIWRDADGYITKTSIKRDAKGSK